MPPFPPRYLSSVARERSQTAATTRGRTLLGRSPEVSLTAAVPELPGRIDMPRDGGAGGLLVSLIGCRQSTLTGTGFAGEVRR